MSDKRTPIGIGVQVNEWSKDQEAKEVFKIVKNYLRPEFINRLDEIIIFNRLDTEQFQEIAALMIQDLAKRLEKLHVRLDFRPEAREALVASIDTANYGARPLKRKLEEKVENKIASLLIQDRREASKTARVSARGQEIDVSLD